MTLVIATVGAFFLAQRLKQGPTILQQLSASPYVSPNEDGRNDVAYIGAVVAVATTIKMEIRTPAGQTVRRFGPVAVKRYRRIRFSWDGRDDADRRAADGRYRIAFVLGTGNAIDAARTIVLDTTAPRVRLLRTNRAGNKFRLETGGRKRTIQIFRRVANHWAPSGYARRLPFGTVRVNVPLGPPGACVVVASARDRAGNIGHSVRWNRRRQAPASTVAPTLTSNYPRTSATPRACPSGSR